MEKILIEFLDSDTVLRTEILDKSPDQSMIGFLQIWEIYHKGDSLVQAYTISAIHEIYGTFGRDFNIVSKFF